MQGLLSDLPLLGVLELIHTTRQTGVLEVEAQVPYTVAFLGGEIVSGGILDWLGTDALYACPLLADSGSFSFARRPVTGQPLGTYDHLITDWARVGDEWEQLCEVIGSPSRAFQGATPPFEAGRTVRSVARELDRPVFEVAQRVAEATRRGELAPQQRHEWFRLRLRPAGRRADLHPVARRLDGQRTLGEVIEQGVTVQQARTYLLGELRLGLRFPGSGWVLRDLIWEQRHERPENRPGDPATRGAEATSAAQSGAQEPASPEPA